MKLMNDTPIEIFIDNGTTPSILPLPTYNKFPILHTYPKTESNTPIHTGGGLITSHFWLEIPLKLQHQTIQIKASVCDSECPYDLILEKHLWLNCQHGKIMRHTNYIYSRLPSH